MILNIIPTSRCGGAEILVKEIHKIYLKKKIESHVIYFSGNNLKNEKNLTFLGLDRWNPLIIFHLRKIIKGHLNYVKCELIIHAHLSWAFFFTALAVIGLRNYKLFYTEHDTTNVRRKIPFFKHIDRFFYSKYYRVVCISRGVYNSLSKWVGPKYRYKLLVIPNGSRIYNIYSRAPLNDRLPKLVSIGSLTQKKNFSVVIDSIPKLKNIIDEYLIVGEGPQKLNLESKIRKLNLESKVKLVGWSENVLRYLNNSDILIIPSLYEGFGLVAVEGMSTGLAVVASKVEGLTEVVGLSNPSVTLVSKFKSKKNWEKGIKIAINKIERIGINLISKYSNTQAKKFTFNKMIEKHLYLYKKSTNLK